MLLKLVYLLVMLLLMWLPELFEQVTVSTKDGASTYTYNIVPWIFFSMATFAFIAFGEYVRRKQKDVWGALIFYSGVPLMVFLSLQLAYESVAITPNRLVYTREPPHTNYNASIDWDQIIAATQVHLEAQDITGRHFRIGYRIKLRTGTVLELPVCDTLSAAATQIDERLNDLRIPLNIETIPLG